MHRSQLAGIIIDCQTDRLDAAAQFWSSALGYQIKQSTLQDEKYATLETAADQPYIEVQKVMHPSRVHLDIETDDIEAEVCRLEQLGAKRLQQIETWWVMEAPTGHRFCVVPPESAEFIQKATVWNND